MRNLLSVVLVLPAILLCGVVIYVMGRRPAIGIAAHEVEAQNQAQSGTGSMGNKAPGSAKRASKQRQDASQEAALDIEAIPTPPLKLFLPSLNPLPSPDDIKPGMARDQVQSVFGEPYMKSAISDQGQLLEVYVFRGKDRDNVTVAQLRDGVVTSSYARVH